MTSSPDMPCSSCGRMLWRSHSSAQNPVCRACRAARRPEKRVRPERACEKCGATFRPSSGRKIRTCSLSCGQALRWDEGRTPWGGRLAPGVISPATTERWQRKNRRRRALKRGAAHEPYSLAEIAERDGYQCGICGEQVSMTLRCPELMAPTIDHVFPIAAGGDDTPANVQLAHFTCNSRKGARVPGLVA